MFTPLLTVLLSLQVAAPSDRVTLEVDDSEATAVLRILELRRTEQEVEDSDWQRLFNSEPFRRLAERARAFGQDFSEDAFRAFVLSDELSSREEALRKTLASWMDHDLEASAYRILPYLPDQAVVRAKIFPVIKPTSNSFVFEAGDDPAIFLYLDPDKSAAQFEITVAHELHHIGSETVESITDSLQADLPEEAREAARWLGAFGEGFAMLAAVGSPEIHPHRYSPPEDRARWDRDMKDFAQDLRELEDFFFALLDGELDNDEARARGMQFFGIQGPWYTVGYRMAATVERALGREVLIRCMLDPRRILARYNEAVEIGAEPVSPTAEDQVTTVQWDPELLRRFGVGDG